MMNDDYIEAEAHEVSLSRWPTTHRPQEYILGAKWRLGFVVGAVWAKARTLERVPQVTINREHGKPATCEIRQGGVLIFSGTDYSAGVQYHREPTDTEIEATARTLFNRERPGNEYADMTWVEVRGEYLTTAREVLIAAKEARG